MKFADTAPLDWSGEILEDIFRNMPTGVLLTDLHGTILDINHALCEMLGYPHELLTGRAISFLHPDESKPFFTEETVETTTGRREIRRLIARSGATIWAEIRMSVVRSRSDESMLRIAFVEDITDRLATQEALNRSAALYKQVVQDQTEMIVRWLPDGTRTFVNDAYARYFGIDQSALIGTSFFPLIAREDVARVEAKIRSLTPETPSQTAVHRVILSDGTIRWNEWTDRATFDEAGHIINLQSIGRDVTDRIEAMDALRASESRHRRLFDDLPIAAWESDWSAVVEYLHAHGLRSLDEFSRFSIDHTSEVRRRLRLLEVNSAALALAGVTTSEDFAAWLPQMYAPESRDDVIRAMGALLFQGVDTHHLEATLSTQSGERREVLIQWGRIRNSGTGWHVITNVIDLTERKEQERELRRSERKYREVFQGQPVAVWETDWTEVVALLHARGIESAEAAFTAYESGNDEILSILQRRRVVSANPKALDMMAVRDIATFSSTMLDPRTFGDEAGNLWQVILGIAFGMTSSVHLGLRLHRHDGSTIDIEGAISPIEATPGRMLVAALDVTDRTRLEHDLLRSQALLERAQTIAHLGSWDLSLDDDELFGSREFWNIFEGREENARRRRFSEMLACIHPDDRERARRVFSSVTGDEWVEELRVVRDDGSTRIVRAQGVFSRTETGELRGHGVAHDVTEIRQAEDAERRQREELLRADRMISLGVLVAGVAHEINNPNQYIMLNAPLLRDAWRDAAPILEEHASRHSGLTIAGIPWDEMRRELPEITSEIDRGAERIRSIVAELQAFGRDHQRGEFRPVLLNEIIKGSLRLLHSHVRKATTNFSCELADNIPMIEANAARLEQVVVNLVLNSCQALTRTGAAIRITTSHDRGRVLLTVADEGRGIAASDLDKIRDPFFTTKRAEGGSGLGLAVCERIVQEHYGLLMFQSEPGIGTTATVSLPALMERAQHE